MVVITSVVGSALRVPNSRHDLIVALTHQHLIFILHFAGELR
jgi:hypothetical protein